MALGNRTHEQEAVNKTHSTLPVTGATREAPRTALDVLASESAAYVKRVESLENAAAQLIQRLRMQEEEEAEVHCVDVSCWY